MNCMDYGTVMVRKGTSFMSDFQRTSKRISFFQKCILEFSIAQAQQWQRHRGCGIGGFPQKRASFRDGNSRGRHLKEGEVIMHTAGALRALIL